MSRGMPWKPHEIERLEELARQNYSLRIIALKLGRSTAAVDAKASQLHIPVRRMKRPYVRRSFAQPQTNTDGNQAG